MTYTASHPTGPLPSNQPTAPPQDHLREREEVSWRGATAFTRRILRRRATPPRRIETSGYLGDRRTTLTSQPWISSAWISRALDPVTYRRSPVCDFAPTLRFAERLAAIGKPVWVRFTLVPGFTDDPANVDGIARLVAPMKMSNGLRYSPSINSASSNGRP